VALYSGGRAGETTYEEILPVRVGQVPGVSVKPDGAILCSPSGARGFGITQCGRHAEVAAIKESVSSSSAVLSSCGK
jgi:hypothetical protein